MHACFQDEQCVYFVMEFVPGGSCGAKWDGRGPGKQWCTRRDEWWGMHGDIMWQGCTCTLCGGGCHAPRTTSPACRLLLDAAGGEFFSHLKARGKLGEDAARLYAGEVG